MAYVSGRGEGGTWVVFVSGKVIEVTKPFNDGETVVLHVSPESVLLSHNFVGKRTSISNFFIARITRIMPVGSFVKVHLDCGFPLVAYITNESRETFGLSEGTEATVSFKATAVQVIARKKFEVDQKRPGRS